MSPSNSPRSHGFVHPTGNNRINLTAAMSSSKAALSESPGNADSVNWDSSSDAHGEDSEIDSSSNEMEDNDVFDSFR